MWDSVSKCIAVAFFSALPMLIVAVLALYTERGMRVLAWFLVWMAKLSRKA